MSGQEGYSSVENWLSRVRPSTAESYRGYMDRWIRWVRENGGRFKDFTPDEFIEYQRGTDNGSKFDVLDLLQKYVLQVKGRRGHKQKCYSNIRSFFMHSRSELPKDPGFNIRGDLPRVVGTLTVDEIKKVIMSSRPVYRAAFLCMFQGGMGQDELVYWSDHGWEQLREAMKGDPEVIKIDLPGRKSVKFDRPYYTFIGGDALEGLKNWISRRPEGATAIFVDQHQNPITTHALYQYWTRHCKSLGIVKAALTGYSGTRYGKHLHEIRDVFRSQWGISTAKPQVGEYVMGHSIDPLEYDRSFRNVKHYRDEYSKALPKLQIMSSGAPFGQVDEDEVHNLQDRVKELEARLEVALRNKEDDRNLEARLAHLEKVLGKGKHENP